MDIRARVIVKWHARKKCIAVRPTGLFMQSALVKDTSVKDNRIIY